ncbi:MAG: hypothetical protein OXU71_02210 [Gammaproteobacteria bacterium]|nr:hypothetical protein [Gammaproteobacteria bacterium]
MKYREELPIDCPPHDAEEVAVDMAVFRLVRDNPPTDEDFRSQRAENPKAKFGVSECQARGLSVFAVLEDARRICKLQRMRDRLICRVQLNIDAGKIKQTGKKSHYTWWPFADFDILANCRVR